MIQSFYSWVCSQRNAKQSGEQESVTRAPSSLIPKSREAEMSRCPSMDEQNLSRYTMALMSLREGRLGMEMHTWDPSTQEVGELRVQG